MVATVVSAGCLAGQDPGAAGNPEVPTARQPGVDDPIRVDVHVVDPTGSSNESVAGARVVLFTKVADNVYDPAYFTGIDDCSFGLDDPPFAVLASATTGQQGRVVGQVRPGAVDPAHNVSLPVYVAVVGPDGYTTEAYVRDIGMSLPCGFSGIQRSRLEEDERQRVTAPVYPTRVHFEVDGTLGPAVGLRIGDRGDRRVWEPRTVYRDPGHLRRVAGVEARLTWTNAGTDWADLYLGIGEEGRDGPCRTGPDRRQRPGDGRNVEVLATRERPCGLFEEARLGAVSDRPVVTSDGIAFRIEGNLTFRGTQVGVPSPGASAADG